MNILYRTKTGSNLYGTSLPTSDVDWKPIFLPDFKSIILGKKSGIYTSKTNNSGDKNSATDVDKEFIPLQTFAYDFIH